MLGHWEEVPSLPNTLGIAAHGGRLKKPWVKVQQGALRHRSCPGLCERNCAWRQIKRAAERRESTSTKYASR